MGDTPGTEKVDGAPHTTCGDPYDTKQLREWRSHQRRVRAALVRPLEWDASPQDLTVETTDPATEYYARRAAAELLERHGPFVANLEDRHASDVLDAAVRSVPDGNQGAESAKTRLINGTVTHHPPVLPVPDEGPDDSQRRREVKEALLLIDIAEAHTRV